uniref:Putative ovule protein n=1 Tax=Solanum chacoense TaxID=4108 RepID=A0A0V0HM75_SOLCH
MIFFVVQVNINMPRIKVSYFDTTSKLSMKDKTLPDKFNFCVVFVNFPTIVYLHLEANFTKKSSFLKITAGRPYLVGSVGVDISIGISFLAWLARSLVAKVWITVKGPGSRVSPFLVFVH